MITTCGIFLYDTRLKSILLCHPTHAKHNAWSIPKGIQEANETPFEAAVRECEEETGIIVPNLHVLLQKELPITQYSKQKKQLVSFLIITDSDLKHHQLTCKSLVNGEFPEIDKWQWETPAQLKGLVHETQEKHLELIEKLVKTF